MTTTPNLAIDHIAAGQDQKEVTANDAFDGLDRAMTETLAVSVASADGAPTAAALLAAVRLAISGATVAGRLVTLPAVRRLFVADLDAASAESVGLVRGATTVAIQPGGAVVLYADGSADGLRVISSYIAGGGVSVALDDITDGPGAPAGAAYRGVRVKSDGSALEYVDRTFEAGLTVVGKPGAGEVLLRYVLPSAVRFAAGLTGWRFVAATAATASTVLTAKLNGTAFGTATVAAAGTTATFAAAALADGVAGDVLTIGAPATADATLADFGLTIYGTRR